MTTAGFCLAKPPQHYVFYLPHGGQAEIRLEAEPGGEPSARWFDPRTGQWQGGPALSGGSNPVVPHRRPRLGARSAESVGHSVARSGDLATKGAMLASSIGEFYICHCSLIDS